MTALRTAPQLQSWRQHSISYSLRICDMPLLQYCHCQFLIFRFRWMWSKSVLYPDFTEYLLYRSRCWICYSASKMLGRYCRFRDQVGSQLQSCAGRIRPILLRPWSVGTSVEFGSPRSRWKTWREIKKMKCCNMTQRLEQEGWHQIKFLSRVLSGYNALGTNLK